MTKPQFSPDPSASRFVSSVVAQYSAANEQEPYQDVDNKPARPNDRRMTDLTRQEVDAKLGQNKAEVDARLANFDTSIKTGFAEARAEAAELRADMHKMHAEIKSWTLATMITIIGTMLAAVFGVATIFNNANKPATATQAPQPVVIYAQPAPAPQAPAPAQPSAK